MTNQLVIPVEICNQSLFEIAEKQYEIEVKNRDNHPVYLVANISQPNDITYHVYRYASKEFIESFKSFKIIK